MELLQPSLLPKSLMNKYCLFIKNKKAVLSLLGSLFRNLRSIILLKYIIYNPLVLIPNYFHLY